MGYLPSYLTDHPSLVGVIRFPKCNYAQDNIKIPVVRHDTEGHYDTVIQTVPMAKNITSINQTGTTIAIPKGSFTDFYPYTYYVLTDGESEPLIMHPQYLGSSLTIYGKHALSYSPVERYYPSYYKGSTDGTIYNITTQSQMLLPTATNEGMSYLTANSNSINQNRKTQNMNNIITGTTALVNAATGDLKGAISNGIGFVNGLEQIKQLDARNSDALMTPNSISSFGTPSTRDKFSTNRVRVVKYTVSNTVKNKVLGYINRYGNKYNNYGTINLRTYRGFVKFVAPNIDAGIDNAHSSRILQILERGIYFE